MTHSTKCPSCAAEIEVHYDAAGSAVDCPACGTSIRILAPDPPPALDLMPEPSPPPVKTAGSSEIAGMIVGAVVWSFMIVGLIWGVAQSNLPGFPAMIGALFLIPIYFLPTLLAQNNRNLTAISIINVFLGWTLVGWVVALVWAVYKPPGTQKRPDHL